MMQLFIEDKNHTEVLQVSASTDRGPIAFFIPKGSEKYLDFNNSLMHLWVKIINVDGTNLANDTDVGLVNYQFNKI